MEFMGGVDPDGPVSFERLCNSALEHLEPVRGGAVCETLRGLWGYHLKARDFVVLKTYVEESIKWQERAWRDCGKVAHDR